MCSGAGTIAILHLFLVNLTYMSLLLFSQDNFRGIRRRRQLANMECAKDAFFAIFDTGGGFRTGDKRRRNSLLDPSREKSEKFGIN